MKTITSARTILQLLKFFGALASQTQDLIISFDKDLKFNYANKAAKSMFQLYRKNIKGKSFSSLNITDVDNIWLESLQEALRTEKQLVIDHTCLTTSGVKYFETILLPVTKDITSGVNKPTNGNQYDKWIFSISRDVTGRKMRVEEIQKQKQLLDNILSVIPVGVWIANESGSIIRSNKTGEEIWRGAKYVPINQLKVYKAWWADSGKQLENEDWAVYRALTKGESSFDEVIEIECFDGTRKTIINSAVPIKEGDKTKGVVVVNQDITRLKETEKQLRKLIDEKEFLFKEANHRIKNNLQIIESLLNLSLENITDDAAINVIEESQGRIKAVSAIHESLYKSYSSNKIYVQHFMYNILELLKNSLIKKQYKNIRIVKEIEDGLISSDTALAVGLITNELVTNSIKHAFTREDEGMIVVSLKLLDKCCELNIKDNGKGIHGDTSEETFGMQLVNTLVEQHSGNLNRIINEGTEYTIQLRLS